MGMEICERVQQRIAGDAVAKIDRDLYMTVVGQLIERGKIERVQRLDNELICYRRI